MHGYTELTPFNRGRFIDYIVLLKRHPCDQCKVDIDKALAHLNEYDRKVQAGSEILEKVFRPKNKLS